MHSIFIYLFSLLAASVNAHFQLQYPPPRGVFDDNNEPKFCGTCCAIFSQMSINDHGLSCRWIHNCSHQSVRVSSEWRLLHLKFGAPPMDWLAWVSVLDITTSLHPVTNQRGYWYRHCPIRSPSTTFHRLTTISKSKAKAYSVSLSISASPTWLLWAPARM